MLLGNYFDENHRPTVSCSLLAFPKMEKKNLSNRDRQKNQLLLSLQVESPIICPLLQKLDEDGLFQEEESWKISLQLHGYTALVLSDVFSYLMEGCRAVSLSA